MAAMTTVLTEFAQNGNSRTCTLASHTATKPRLVIEKRRVPEGNQQMVEYSFRVIEATTDAAGAVLSNKVSLEAIGRYPLGGDSADLTASLATFRDIIAGDEFANSLITQEWL